MRCPNCRSKNITTTLKGCFPPARDTNEARCQNCGEYGTVWQWKRIEQLETQLFNERISAIMLDDMSPSKQL